MPANGGMIANGTQPNNGCVFYVLFLQKQNEAGCHDNHTRYEPVDG
jgi:hypothetical protein